MKSTLVLGAATVFAKIAGFARDGILAAIHGASAVSDAFILAYTIVEVFVSVIGVSLAASFIPMYHRAKDKDAFTKNVMTCLLLLGLLLSVIFTIVPEVLVWLLAFQLAPETFEMAVFFVRYMIWALVFVFMTDVYNSHLEIKGAFFSSGLRNMWRNGMIGVGLILGSVFNFNLLIALAPVVGSALRMFMLSLSCRKHGFVYRPVFDICSPEIKQMLILSSPVFLSAVFNQINILIGRNFAASLSIGNISYLNYSYRISVLFIGLFGTGIFTVLYPHMSKLAADGDIVDLKNILTRSIVYILAIMMPLCVGLIILAQPTVRIIFQRGAFSLEDTVNTAACLRMHSLFLIPGSIMPLLARVFYVMQNTKTPVYISVVSIITGIAFNILLVTPLGAEGLALSASLSGFVGVALLLIFLRSKLGSFGFRNTIPELVKIIVAVSVMGTALWIIADMLPLMSATTWQSVLLYILMAVIAVVIYGLALLLQKSSILPELAMVIKNRK